MQSEPTPPAADAEVDKLPTTIEEIRAQTPPAEPQKSPLLEALRAELRRLVDGDLDANLVPIEQVAARGRELLMTLKAPEARVIRGRHPVSPFVNSGGNYSTASSVGGWSEGGLVQQPYPLQATSPEQFGATAVRQMVSLVPDAVDKIVRGITQSPERLVLAITAARERGQDALADKLEARLLGDDAAPAKDSHSPTPAATNGTTTNGKATLPASTTAE